MIWAYSKFYKIQERHDWNNGTIRSGNTWLATTRRGKRNKQADGNHSDVLRAQCHVTSRSLIQCKMAARLQRSRVHRCSLSWWWSQPYRRGLSQSSCTAWTSFLKSLEKRPGLVQLFLRDTTSCGNGNFLWKAMTTSSSSAKRKQCYYLPGSRRKEGS